MSQTEKKFHSIPKHLEKYIVDQDYSKYTWEDQAVWRYVLRQLRNHLGVHGHSSYSLGLKATGVTLEEIPRIEDMDVKMQQLGWRVVAVSGFIPPAAFMELQSLGYLPIACDIRTKEHILYTPAPDIVHEAAGHAPIIADKEYATYLHRYADVANKALLNKEDLEIYSYIRKISDLKEHPDSSPEEVSSLEAKLDDLFKQYDNPSEASLVSRMNWWTAEYGLIKQYGNMRIYGAGLLSSIGEAKSCLFDNVEKIPLTVDCIKTNYDITRPQPQLFYIENFETLNTVLDDLAEQMAFKIGGLESVKKAIVCKSVNTIVLDSGLQISGNIVDVESDLSSKAVTFVRFAGPTQLAHNNSQLNGHGKDYHSHGYSSPLGGVKGQEQPLHQFTKHQLMENGFAIGNNIQLLFENGFEVKGRVKSILAIDETPLLMALEDCTVQKDKKVYFEPSWGTFDMALGEKVVSVFGGPADFVQFGDVDSFTPQTVPPKTYTENEIYLFDFYKSIRDLRTQEQDPKKKLELLNEYVQNFKSFEKFEWLLGIELLELMHRFNLPKAQILEFENYLKTQPIFSDSESSCMHAGIHLADCVL